jgi:hypothetical protein
MDILLINPIKPVKGLYECGEELRIGKYRTAQREAWAAALRNQTATKVTAVLPAVRRDAGTFSNIIN